jgi:hypothetical protein
VDDLAMRAFESPADPDAAWTEAIAAAASPTAPEAHQAWTDALEGGQGAGGEPAMDLADEPVANMETVAGAEVSFEDLGQET